MTELDHVWSQMLGAAGEKAMRDGDADLAKYLRLKTTNDAIRSRGVGWLFETLISLASDEQRRRHGIVIEREEPYSFPRANSTMIGAALLIRQGVRCLTVAAGWARTPSDGIMQKGALAYARLTHFGMPGSAAELMLAFNDSLPTWRDEGNVIVDAAFLKRHIDVVVG